MRQRRMVTAVALAGVWAFGAGAQAADEGEYSPLETMVITDLAPQSALTFTTDPRLPRQPVPASDGTDYLRTIPGFSAIRNGGTNGDPVLRGMFGSRLNLLTNDGNMPGACPARMDNPMSYVAPETYDRLTVIKGPQTVQWGPGASAGTVRFERDTEHFHEPGVRLNASALGASFGRNDQMIDVIAGAPAGYARLSGNRSESNDYKDGNGDVVPSQWNKWNADAALGWTPDEDTLLEFSAGGGDGEARYAGRGMDGAQFERTSLGLRFEKKNLDGAMKEMTANAYFNYVDHVMDNYTLREPNPMSAMPMPMASNVDRRTIGARVATGWELGDFSLVAGVDAQESRHRERNASGRHVYRTLPWTTDAEFSNLGVFGELTWHLQHDRRMVGGLRHDWARVTDERQTVGSMMMQMPNPTAGETRRETLPSGFLRYERDHSALNWYAGIGHTERMPDYWELFSPNAGPEGSVNAFSAVEPEKTTQIDIGAQYSLEQVDLWVSAYAGRIEDFILFTYTEGGMMGMSSSVAGVSADIRGGEAGLEYRPFDYWSMSASLAYARGKNRDAGTPMPQIPPLEGRLTLRYDNARWSAVTLLRLVDGQHRVALDQGNIVGRDISESSGFALLSINGAYRINEHWQVSAGVDNLFDRTYSEHLNLAGSADFGFPADPVRINEPGRSAWLKVNLSY